MDFKKHCLCEFGKYVESRDGYVMTNNMTPSTHEEIALGPSGNLQGEHKVFFLETGIVLKRRVNMVAPMPYQVTKKMNQWGEIKKRE